MSIKTVFDNALYRTYMVFFIIAMIGLAVLVRASIIQLIEGAYWRAKAKEMYVKSIPVEAARGNIYARDGSLLATSLPYYEVRWDATVVNKDTFDFNVDELATDIATYVSDEFTIGALREKLIEAYNNKERYFLIAKNISYPTLQRLQTFPIFRDGQYKGGIMITQQNRRQRPFKMLAARTVGRYDITENEKGGRDTFAIGLEGYFNEYIGGDAGEQLMQNVGGNTWIPVNDISDIEPKQGMDLVTTLDVNIQDVAENALMKAMVSSQSKHGCAIVMDVKTGAIRAMANIGRTESGEYAEDYNYATAMSTEPGSTFKLATMLSLLEDGYVNPEDSIDLNQGRMIFYNEDMVDAEAHGLNRTSIQHAFEISSNVGMAQLVDKYYNKGGREYRYLQHLASFHLDQLTGIELGGEPNPYIKNKNSTGWSQISLPWMATGYELKLTPLQLLTFYNAVANGGMMMKPYLVEQIKNYGKVFKQYRPEVIDRSIASSGAITAATKLLQGVVERGTAKGIYTDQYPIAGKTGTTILNFNKFNAVSKKYQASFAGFFPADKPLYSCVVVLYEPVYGIYGGAIAAPVFREIADKCYATEFSAHTALNGIDKKPLSTAQMPDRNAGYKNDLIKIYDELNINYRDSTSDRAWAISIAKHDTLELATRNNNESYIPNVVGMGLRDAVYLLENRGVKVRATGVGKVKSQSVKPGQSIRGVRYISLVLD